MELVRRPGKLTGILTGKEMRKVTREGYVIHAYSAPHYARGMQVCALKVELPQNRQYARLGYRLVARFTKEDLTGNALRIGTQLT